MEKLDLEVKKRIKIGKKSKGLRALGLIPAIVYGRDIDTTPVEIEEKVFHKFLGGSAHKNMIINLKFEGNSYPVLMHEVQRDIISNKVLHVDFYRVSMDEAIKTKVPIVLIGVAEGVKSDGGILVHPLREIEIKALPSDIPQNIEINISELKIGDSIHVSNLKAIKDVEFITPAQDIIVTISAPTKEEEVAPVAVEAVPGAVAEGAAPAAGAAAPAAGAAAPAAGAKAPAAEAAPKQGAPKKASK